MEIKYIDEGQAQVVPNQIESTVMLKILHFVLKELEYEYSTRTGFYENETKEIIQIFQRSVSGGDRVDEIRLTHQQIFNLRQNLAEVLFGIKMANYSELFEVPKEIVMSYFNLFDKYGTRYHIWDKQ